jgi:hypothetical protein
MRLETPLHPFSDLQELVDAHSAAFCSDFGSLFEKVKQVYKESKRTENGSKVGAFVLRNKHLVMQVAQSKSLSLLNVLLFLIAEIQNLKIKLFEVCGAELVIQRFGSGFRPSLNVFRSGHSLSFLIPLNNSFEEDICCHSDSYRKSSMSNAKTATHNPDVHSEKRSKASVEERSTDAELLQQPQKGTTQSVSAPMDLSLNSENSSISIKSVLSSRPKRLDDSHSRNISNHHLKSSHPSRTIPGFSEYRQIVRSHTGGFNNCPPVKAVVDSQQIYSEGKIKFFSEQSHYGFISADGEDTYVHRDELGRACIDLDRLTSLLKHYAIHVKFRSVNYQAKGRVARKATEVSLVDFVPLFRP